MPSAATIDPETVEWGEVRADRVGFSDDLIATLPRKVQQADGAVRFWAVLARADVAMKYAHGTEVATEEALSDPAYLDALKGISVTTVDSAPHKMGKAISVRADARAVGTVLDARWDAEHRAVLVQLVVNDGKTLDAIESGRIRALSEAYVPAIRVRADGVLEQTRRRTNHVALVRRGRMPGARLRADNEEETTMTEDEIGDLARAIVAAMKAGEEDDERSDMYDAEKKRADEAEQRADAAEAALKDLRKKVGINADSDDIAAALDERVAEAIRADAALLDEARDLGVDLGDESSPSTRLRDLAVALGADATRADSDDYARSFVDGVKAAPQPRKLTAAQRHAEGARKATTTTGARRRVS
jgi:hypothetical protein